MISFFIFANLSGLLLFDRKSRLLCLTTLHYFSYVDSNFRLAEVSNLINASSFWGNSFVVSHSFPCSS